MTDRGPYRPRLYMEPISISGTRLLKGFGNDHGTRLVVVLRRRVSDLLLAYALGVPPSTRWERSGYQKA
jgi:hypothetical protein